MQTDPTPSRTASAAWWLGGLVVSLMVVVAAALLASEDPDGLERVAEDQDFIGAGADAPYEVIPDYTVPGIEGGLSTILAGVIGVVVVFALLVIIGRVLARRRPA